MSILWQECLTDELDWPGMAKYNMLGQTRKSGSFVNLHSGCMYAKRIKDSLGAELISKYFRLMLPFDILRYFKYVSVPLSPEEIIAKVRFSHLAVARNCPYFRGLFGKSFCAREPFPASLRTCNRNLRPLIVREV